MSPRETPPESSVLERASSTTRRLKVVLWFFCSLLALVVLPWAWSRLFASEIVVSEFEGVGEQSQRNSSLPLSIGTYNIAHGRGLSESNWTGEDKDRRGRRLVDISREIEGRELDVVVLNEVDLNALWSHGTNQAEAIANAAGYPFVVEVPSYDFLVGPCRFRFGNAVISRFPLRGAEVVDLPSYSRLEALLAGKKKGIAVTIEAPGGAIRLLAVHLSHRSEPLRVASARQLIARARRSSLPVVIAGDTNSTPTGFPGSASDEQGQNAMDLFAASGLFQQRPTSTPDDRELTFHATDPTTVIDWILVPTDWEIESYQVIPWEHSDHRPVVARFRR